VRIHMQERARSDLELTSQEYQWWAFAEEILGDVGQLKSILLRWLEQEPENLQARTSLAEINRFLFVKLLHSVQPNPEVLANLLIDTANLSSDATTLHLLANDLFRQQHPGAQRIRIPIAKKVISHLVHSPRASAPICEALASTTVAAGDLVLAKTLLARAVAQDASQAKVWNNYAWVLNHGSKKDLDRAIGAINRGLELAPNELRFRETRGQILVNLGRWQEAVTDLEYALNGMPGNKQIHISLANAYAALGEDDLAQHHRRQRE
jgi:tetratricopeptide (TPR) repeat protein